MPTLIVASESVVYDRLLGEAARSAGWTVFTCGTQNVVPKAATPAVYVTTEHALKIARQLNLVLLEPQLDFLTQIPNRFLLRIVEAATFEDLERLQAPTFVKPADPLDKWFDAGVYSEVGQIRTKGRQSPEAPVLLSEPVEWSAELRYFVHAGRVVAGSPYMAFGRPNWKPFDRRKPTPIPTAGLGFVEGLCAAMRNNLPPAFVVDVGMIEDRGWAVVEFNPVWCAGLLGADPRAVLPMLQRVACDRDRLPPEDSRWVVPR